MGFKIVERLKRIGKEADSYGILDPIAGRTLAQGGRAIDERNALISGEGSLAAVLRYPLSLAGSWGV